MALTRQQIADLMPDASKVESDKPQMESSLHYHQLALLVTCLEWWWRDRQDFFIGPSLTIFYSRKQLKTREFSGPDFFLVKDTVKRPRRSWVVWEEEGRYPDLIIELLSDSTAEVDRHLKKQFYHRRFRTPEYFWFSPEDLELAGFQFRCRHYQPITPNQAGQLWSNVLGLYLGVHQRQLRYFTAEGQLVSTPQEAAFQAQSLVERERERAERERERAERLAAQLKALGIEPLA